MIVKLTAVFSKEWRLLWRDQIGLIFLFILPMCLVLFITLTSSQEPDRPRQLKLVLINQDSNGNIILQTAKPGQLGSLGLRPLYGPGTWNFDANLQKRIRFTESKAMSVRVDASNLFNHPTPGNPNLNLNTGTFGEINTKTGFRTLAGQVRLEF